MLKKHSLNVSLLVACLVVFAGCQKEEPKKEHAAAESHTTAPSVPQGQVLLSVDGKPKITVDDFERYKEQFFMIQPQYKQILQFMPKSEQLRIDQNIFQNMVNEVLFQVWVEKNNVDQRKDYQADYNMIMDMGKRNLAIKYYQEENPTKVTEAEIRKFYEENKDKMPELMESQGGVNAKAVKFENETDAKAFLNKVKEAGGDLEKTAKDEGHKVENLHQVNQMSFNVDTPVRQKLLEVKKFPTHLHVKVDDNSHYVVHATGKDQPKYVPFEQVKAGLQNFLNQQKMGDMLTKAAEDLKKKYDATENTEYFTQMMAKAEQEEKEKQEKAAKEAPKAEKKPMPAAQSAVKGA